MTLRIDYEFKIDGLYHSVNYYRSETNMDTASMPAPIATGIESLTYSDLTVEEGKTYFVRFGAIGVSGIEKISDEIKVIAKSSLWFEINIVMDMLSSAANSYHTKTGTASTSNMSATLDSSAKWAGGVLAPSGKIYCVPVNATDILIIDPITNTATRSNMGATLSDTNKWRGGVLAPNGKIYCIPYNATDILIIDPVNNTATRSNMGASLTGTAKWFGGALGPDGKIYCAPYSSADILIIDPVTNTATRSNMGAPIG
ncbi:MAG: hypothetical protein RSB25_16630, partial [Acinetobacter sp.]